VGGALWVWTGDMSDTLNRGNRSHFKGRPLSILDMALESWNELMMEFTACSRVIQVCAEPE
jgi:hypothetical protein